EEDQRPLRDTRSRRQLRLEVIEPREYEGKVYDLDGEVTVGRSNGCGIPTTYDSYSSTVHARLYRSGGQIWVEDLGSTNGTFVNSERISQPSRLAKGDLLQIGATVFEVRRGQSFAPGAPPISAGTWTAMKTVRRRDGRPRRG